MLHATGHLRETDGGGAAAPPGRLRGKPPESDRLQTQ